MSLQSLRVQQSNLVPSRSRETKFIPLSLGVKILLIIFILMTSQTQARTLDLSKQKIKEVSNLTIPEGTTKLKLQRNKITKIASLELPSTLQSLNIAKNKISDLNQLKLNEGLKTLTAFSNQITTINGLVLPEGLQSLGLDINNIKDARTLQLPQSLEHIGFLSCNISNEGINGLVLSANLDSLELAFNDLTTLDGIQFNDKITELSLNANAFTEMDWHSIPASVINLDFGGNREVTNYDEMVLPPNLKIFSLGVIFFENPSFMNGKLPDTLTHLALRRNFIDSLEAFEIPPNLEELDLEHNSLTSFDYELPESMRVLDLRDNPISKQERRRIRARYQSIPKLKIKF